MDSRRQRPLNRKLIASDIAEANEELAKLLHTIVIGNLNEEQLQVSLQHAYHHLNFAWNVRGVLKSEYSPLIQAKFEKWGKYPKDIDKV